MSGHLALVASTTLYGLGIVAQTTAAQRAEKRPGSGLGLLARLAKDWVYLLGFAGQVGGFVLAFFARASLPLYLVQAGSSCAIGLATVFGFLALGWRVRALEVGVLVLMAVGLLLLAAASTPSVAHDVPTGLGLVLYGLPLLALVYAVRVHGVHSVVLVAVFAGAAYAVVAMTSRSLADEPVLDLLFHPLTWVMLLAALIGQACLAVALQNGSATSTVASMDATTVVLTSVVGIAALGDRIAPGRQWWVVLGVAMVVVGVLVLGSTSRTAPAVASAEAVG